MKQLLLALVLLATVQATVHVQAQTGNDTLYGFRQYISPGIKKAGDMDEKGKLIKKPSPHAARYTIYLFSPAKVRMYPIQLWINGDAYAVEADTIPYPPQLPTNIQTPAARKRYFFPETTGTIYRLTPKPLLSDKSTSKGKRLAARNAVVLLYKKGGTLYYEVLKKFTDLETAALQ